MEQTRAHMFAVGGECFNGGMVVSTGFGQNPIEGGI
jgi:hypothetical protein